MDYSNYTLPELELTRKYLVEDLNFEKDYLKALRPEAADKVKAKIAFLEAEIASIDAAITKLRK